MEKNYIPYIETLCESLKKLYPTEIKVLVSIRLPDGNMAVSTDPISSNSIAVNDFSVFNINDVYSAQTHVISPAAALHAEIYYKRYEINALLQIQSPYAVNASGRNHDIPPILDDMAQIIGPTIRTVKYPASTSKKLLRSATRAMNGRNGVLLAGYGALCAGRDLDETLVSCEIFEKSCKVFIESAIIGGAIAIDMDEAEFMHGYYLKKYSMQKKDPVVILEQNNSFTPVLDKALSIKIHPTKEAVCLYGKKLLESGLVSGTWGNVSCRVGENHMVITPSGLEYQQLKPEDIVLVNIHDLSFEGNLRPSSELGLHAEVYKTREDIQAVIHTHSSNASVAAAARKEVPSVTEEQIQLIGRSIAVAEYALPGTSKIVKATIKALKGRNAALMANHGVVCLGRDMESAFKACELVEKACMDFVNNK